MFLYQLIWNPYEEINLHIDTIDKELFSIYSQGSSMYKDLEIHRLFRFI